MRRRDRAFGTYDISVEQCSGLSRQWACSGYVTEAPYTKHQRSAPWGKYRSQLLKKCQGYQRAARQGETGLQLSQPRSSQPFHSMKRNRNNNAFSRKVCQVAHRRSLSRKPMFVWTDCSPKCLSVTAERGYTQRSDCDHKEHENHTRKLSYPRRSW